MNIIDSLLSINFTSGREGHDIKNIILHTMSSTVSGIDALFRNPDVKVSAHYGIGLNGDIRRWVLEADVALQTDNEPANLQSVGITHEDNANPSDGVRTDAMYNASAELVADLCKRYGIPCKLVEIDGNHMPAEPGIVLHHQVSLRPTGCPDGLDGDRIIRQARAILDPPVPEPPKPVVYEALPALKKMRIKNMANGGVELWDLTFQAWSEDITTTIPSLLLFKWLNHLLVLIFTPRLSFAKEADEETSLSYVSPDTRTGKRCLSRKKGQALPGVTRARFPSPGHNGLKLLCRSVKGG